jgi:hypothetical protein
MIRPRARGAAAVLATLALSAAGCESLTGPGAERERLRESRARWRRQGIDDYEMRQANSCFCPPTVRGPALVTVRDGVITSLVLVSDGQPVPQEAAAAFRTVEDLFAQAEDALDRHFELVAVDYHPQLGHPVRIDLDGSRQVADDEMTISVDGLTPFR